MLLLFDIDGTLIRCGGAGRRAMDRAFFSMFGLERALDRVRLDGSTDPIIIQSAFEIGFGRKPEAEEIDRLLGAYLALLREELVATKDAYVVLRGAAELVSRATDSRSFVLGLATGNHERGARIKLEPCGLNRFFSFGGFGSDAADRRQLVARAIERGQAEAEKALGRRFAQHEIFVFGDTGADVTAARHCGVMAVGVLEGSWAKEELTAARPDLLVDSFADPALLARIGLIEGVS